MLHHDWEYLNNERQVTGAERRRGSCSSNLKIWAWTLYWILLRSKCSGVYSTLWRRANVPILEYTNHVGMGSLVEAMDVLSTKSQYWEPEWTSERGGKFTHHIGMHVCQLEPRSLSTEYIARVDDPTWKSSDVLWDTLLTFHYSLLTRPQRVPSS